MAETLPDIWRDPALSIAETVLQQQLETTAPALAQIPLLSLAIAAYKSKGAMSDYLLARKVQQFYSAWELLEEPQRRKIYQKFQKKPKAFIEKLLLIIAQQEDLQKCKLLGVLTTAYLRADITRADYTDLIETVAYLSLGDLILLGSLADLGMIFPERKIGERYANLFIARGLLVTEPLLPSEQRTSEEPFYRATKLGTLFSAQVRASHLRDSA